MQFYHSIEKLKQDIDWLTYTCTLPFFAENRVSEFEYSEFSKKYLQPNNIDNKRVLSAYNQLVSLIGLENKKWTDTIADESLPCLALVPNGGLCVVFSKIQNGAWGTDSAEGTKEISKFPLGTKFFQIRKDRYKNYRSSSAYEMFKSVALREKKHIIYAVLATISINILALASSFFSMQVYDRVVPTHGISTLIALSIGAFLAICLEIVLKISRSVILDEASTSMDRSYSHNIFDRFLKVRSDALPNSIGTLSGQLQGYASIRTFISTAALYFIIDLPFSLFFLAVIVMLGGIILGAVPLVFFLISLVTAFFFKNKIEKLTEQSVAANNKKLGLLVESVENSETIKANGASFAVQGKWNALTENAINDDIAIRHYSELSVYISALLQQFGYIALVAVGAYLVTTTNDITMGGLIAVSILSSRVLSPIAMLPNIFVQGGRAKMSLVDLNNIYALPQDNEGVEKPLVPDILEPKYSCQNLKFNYSDSKQALNIQNLNILAGERVAILGVIGSGKSTLLKVLSGIYAPKEGNVLIGGIDMHHIARHKISSKVGYLPQATKLTSGTLRDNITAGLVGISDTKIMEAANLTGLIHLLTNLPKGLDTYIPEGGNTLSGGQKQLIALTRLVVADPTVWLLDEPTANMDDSTEANILRVINSLVTPQKTLILVTHKPALLALVNRIIVLTPNGIVMDGPKNLVLEKLSANQTANQNRQNIQNQEGQQ